MLFLYDKKNIFKEQKKIYILKNMSNGDVDDLNDVEVDNIFQKEYEGCNENDLYTQSLLIKFSKYLYKNNCNIQKLFSLNIKTKTIKSIFSSFLNIDMNSEIIGIYWEEFKAIKHFFITKYLNGLHKIKLYYIDTLNFVKNRLYVEPFFDISLSKYNFCLAFDKFCMNPNPSLETKSKLICKVCFNNIVTCALIHDNHCCAVMCNECLDKINDEYPFCKCKINEKKKFII